MNRRDGGPTNADAQRTPVLRASDVPRQPAPSGAANAFPYEPGEEIPGTHHVVVEAVGIGKWGAVYVVQHARLLKKFRTIKLLNTSTDRNDNETAARIANLAHEAQLIAELDHPNIVKVIDSGVTTDAKRRPYFIMEEGDARSLHKLVASAKASRRDEQMSVLGVPETLQIAIEAADAVAHIHNHDIVHCDIKADNIVLQRDVADRYITKVIDFGLALRLEEDGAAPHVLGTPLFASPEQHRGERLTPATDVYSLAQALYYVATGTAPYEDRVIGCGTKEDVFEVLKRAHTGDERPRHLSARVSDMPVEFCDLVMAMMAPSPAARPTSWVVASKLRDIQSRFNADERERLSSALDYETDPGSITGVFAARDVRDGARDVRGPHGTRPLAQTAGDGGELAARHAIRESARETPNVFAKKTVDVVDTSDRNKTDVDADDPWWLQELRLEHRAREEARRAILVASATRTMTPAPATESMFAHSTTPAPSPVPRLRFARAASRLRLWAARTRGRVGTWAPWSRGAGRSDVVYIDPERAIHLADEAMRAQRSRRRWYALVRTAVLFILGVTGCYVAIDAALPREPLLRPEPALVIERELPDVANAWHSDAPAPRETDAR